MVRRFSSRLSIEWKLPIVVCSLLLLLTVSLLVTGYLEVAPSGTPAPHFLRNMAVIAGALLAFGLVVTWLVSRRLADAFNHMAAQVKDEVAARASSEAQFLQAQKMEAVGRLAGGVAHDFNNLLTAIMSYAELIRSDLPADDRSIPDVDEILRAARQAHGLTRQLLAFSRQQVLRPVTLSPNTVVTEVGRMLRRLIGEDIELVTDLHPRIGNIKADPGQIEQVLMNLAVNARDAMRAGGKLTISTANADLDAASTRLIGVPEGGYVLLTISDTGVGMSAETQARIFEPFYTTKEEGTGLGLATVYGIVTQGGGHVRVESEPGCGSTFRIYIPRLVDEGTAGRSMQAEIEVREALDTV